MRWVHWSLSAPGGTAVDDRVAAGGSACRAHPVRQRCGPHLHADGRGASAACCRTTRLRRLLASGRLPLDDCLCLDPPTAAAAAVLCARPLMPDQGCPVVWQRVHESPCLRVGSGVNIRRHEELCCHLSGAVLPVDDAHVDCHPHAGQCAFACVLQGRRSLAMQHCVQSGCEVHATSSPCRWTFTTCRISTPCTSCTIPARSCSSLGIRCAARPH